MDKPTPAALEPVAVELEAGEKIFLVQWRAPRI